MHNLIILITLLISSFCFSTNSYTQNDYSNQEYNYSQFNRKPIYVTREYKSEIRDTIDFIVCIDRKGIVIHAEQLEREVEHYPESDIPRYIKLIKNYKFESDSLAPKIQCTECFMVDESRLRGPWNSIDKYWDNLDID